MNLIDKIKEYATDEVRAFIEDATLLLSAPVAEGSYMCWDEQFTHEKIILHTFAKGAEKRQVWETVSPGENGISYYFSIRAPKKALSELLLRRPLMEGIPGVLELALTEDEWKDFDLGLVKDCLLYTALFTKLPFGDEVLFELKFEGENLREWPSLKARLSAYKRSAEACQQMWRAGAGSHSGRAAVSHAPEFIRGLLGEKVRILTMPLGPERLNAILDDEYGALSTRKVADLCGVSRTTVAEWRRGERDIPISCWRVIEARWKGIL